jgi:hypothetical protein
MPPEFVGPLCGFRIWQTQVRSQTKGPIGQVKASARGSRDIHLDAGDRQAFGGGEGLQDAEHDLDCHGLEPLARPMFVQRPLFSLYYARS